MTSHSQQQRGFTLIELVITIGIFSVFLIIMSGVFSRFLEVERHSIEQGALILEVQSIIESFIKEAKTAFGSSYSGPSDGTHVTFRNQLGACVMYRQRMVIENNVQRGIFERAEDRGNTAGSCDSGSFGSVPFTPLTSNSMNISNIFFDITTSGFDNTNFQLENQGVVTLVITAQSSRGNSSAVPVTVQNTVTSRQIRAYNQ